VGGRQIRLVAAAAMVLALIVALASPVLSGAAKRKGGGIEIEIITCPDGSQPPPGATSPEDCQQGTTKLPPAKKKRPPSVDQPKAEVHEVDLGTGDKKVSGAGGDELDLNLKVRDSEGNVDLTPVEQVGTGASGGALPPVSTSGGALPGAASPFDYVSTDQALASFEVPPFLLPIYVSAGRAYDIPWNVLAAINRHETDFGRLGACVVSSAGAQGWMQFIPSTWEQYGVDASGDGAADPCNPVDAIYAAARYLNACSDDLREQLFCYNHADWYVDMVLRTASVYGSLPGGLVTETGSLAYGHFPVRGEVSYGDDFREAELAGRTPSGLWMQPSGRASAVATQNATVTRVLLSPELARAFRRDPGRAAAAASAKPAAPAPQAGETAAAPTQAAPPESAAPDGSTSPDPESSDSGDSGEFGWLVPLSKDLSAIADLASGDLAFRPEPPAEPVTVVGGGTWTSDQPALPARAGSPALDGAAATPAADGAAPTTPAASKPADVNQLAAATDSSGPSAATGAEILPGANGLPDGYEVATVDGVGIELTDPVGNHYRYQGLEKLSPELRPGAEVEGNVELGPLREGKPMHFSLTAAGGAQVDPRPMVDGYRLQEATNYFHAVEPIGGNPFLPDSETIAAGIVSGDQAQLAQRVLNDPGISIYDCGRGDVSQGIVDKRILGALLYLRSAGMTLTVTSLRCGHGYYTAGGSVSAHSYGAAVDIAAFNGQPVIGNQGPGSLTEQAIKLLMQLQGPAQPNQLISLMSFGGPSFALSDHDDHLHVGYSFSTALDLGQSGDGLAPPVFGGAGAVSGQGLTKPEKGAEAQKHEQQLSEKLGKIENPEVPGKASPGAPRVRDEAERRSEHGAAAKVDQHEGTPIELHPSSSGAEMIAVDVPGGDADEAYGLGVVDGIPHGWAEHQIVALAYRDGAWTVIGPPADAKGNVANPKLTELAAAPGGKGYAVGEDGAVAELRGDAPPRLIASHTKGNFTDVDVASGGAGYAVGAQAGVVQLSGGRVTTENSGAQTSPTAVTSGGAETLMAGSGAAGRPALLKRLADGTWRPMSLDLRLAPGASVAVESVAADGGEIWIGGSLADSAGTPLKVPFVAHRGGGGGWETFCSINPALSVVEELGTPTAGPCQHGLPTSTPGASVSAIQVGGDGPIAAAGDVLVPLDETHQRATAAFGPIKDLAVGPSHSEGFALGPHGSLVRIGPEAADAQTKVQELALGNASPVLVSAAAEDSAIALGDGRAATRSSDGSWQLTEPTGLGVRDVAWAGETAWAIDELGVPLQLTDAGWSAPGEDDSQQELREKLAGVLGGDPLSPPESGGDNGLRALSFSSPGVGFAVGDGLIGHYVASTGWVYKDTDAALTDVAASEDHAVAVGADGALLELGGDGWKQSAKASELANGADLTAAAALDDGTLLAAGGGVVLAREPDADEWSAVELPPLGVPVRRLAGIRGEDGTLEVFALADAGGQLVALRGAGGSWRPIGVQGVTVSDLAVVPGTSMLLLGGDRSGQAVTVEIDSEAAAEPNVDEATGADGGDRGQTHSGE
jgi:hypothetical protein